MENMYEKECDTKLSFTFEEAETWFRDENENTTHQGVEMVATVIPEIDELFEDIQQLEALWLPKCAEKSPATNHNSDQAKKKGKVNYHWTRHEHKLFLEGVEKYGQGEWKIISQEFVPSKSPKQVASHAQKYFLRAKQMLNNERKQNKLKAEKKKKKVNHWKEDEHMLFLEGLEKYGKGYWKSISCYIRTKSPSQVSSHAQKYFLKQKLNSERKQNKRKRSIMDMTIVDMKETRAFNQEKPSELIESHITPSSQQEENVFNGTTTEANTWLDQDEPLLFNDSSSSIDDDSFTFDALDEVLYAIDNDLEVVDNFQLSSFTEPSNDLNTEYASSSYYIDRLERLLF